MAHALILSLLLLAWPALASGTTLVETCGQTVRGVAELTGDLDCSAVADESVRLSGRLDLRGFTITGNPAHDVVECSGGCMIVGPGTITGGAEGVNGTGHVKVTDATITLNTGDGIHADSNARVSGATVTDNLGDGVRTNGGARISSSVLSGNGGSGVEADHGVAAFASTVTANAGDGIVGLGTVRVRDTTIVGNGFDGVRGRRILLRDASANGNATDASCGTTDECADLASSAPPRLMGTSTCGTSRDTALGGTWGACTGD